MKKILFPVLIFLSLCGCRKTFDNPPYKPVNDGAVLDVKQLKARTVGANSLFRFSAGDTNLYCTVIMDESSGNIYKQIFVRDDGGNAMQVRLLEGGGLFTGDRIRINLNNLWLVSANNMVYLDSVSMDHNIVKLSSGHVQAPKVTTLERLLSFNGSAKETDNLQSQLIELNQVEFHFSHRGKPFANSIGRTAYEYLLTDCQGREIGLRTSGMSNFAAKLTPSGNGKLTAVVQQYNSEMSLIIRNYNEVQMNEPACVSAPPATITGQVYLQKDFNDGLVTSGGWLNVQAAGTTSWITSDFAHESYYARIYNKTGAVFEPCESWLISPAIDLSAALEPILIFETASSSTASPLSVMISENYNGGPPSAATWTAMSYHGSKGNFSWEESGQLPLSGFRASPVRIAFRYSGTASSGSIWELDDIAVFDPEK